MINRDIPSIKSIKDASNKSLSILEFLKPVIGCTMIKYDKHAPSSRLYFTALNG